MKKVNAQIPLTPKQKGVLDFINRFTVKHGYAPSLQEIADHIQKSISTVQHFIDELQSKGYLQRREHVSRGIFVLDDSTKQIFKLGYIAAGEPIDPIENPEPIDVPASFLRAPGNYYALEVKGDSMIEDNIQDGDTIVIRYQQTAETGDRIVAITEKGATLKVFKKRGGKIYLEPRNQNLKPIYPKRLEVRGKFCGLIRRDN